MSNWIECQYNDDGEISNPDFVAAPSDSWWWVDSHNRLMTVMIKTAIYFRPTRIALVEAPE